MFLVDVHVPTGLSLFFCFAGEGGVKVFCVLFCFVFNKFTSER